MKAGKSAFVFLFLIVSSAFFADMAGAANGTLKIGFKYTDPATGITQNLNYGFIYLHYAANPAPMEKYFTKADYILGPSNYGDGIYTVAVPEGQYYIRITQRKIIGSSSRPYGPPETGDYTWFQTTPITIAAGQTLDLGTQYARLFASVPITISGTVTSSAGVPLAGRYVRAQTEPCRAPVNCTASGCDQYGNECGPAKFLALLPTDANGSYTLLLADPGTYYIYTSPCLVPGHNQNDGGRCVYTAAPAPVTVNRGDSITVNMVVN